VSIAPAHRCKAFDYASAEERHARFCPRSPTEAVRLREMAIPPELYKQLAALWHVPPIFEKLYSQFIPIGISTVTQEHSGETSDCPS